MSDGMRILNEEDVKQSVKYLEEMLDNKVSPRCVYIFYSGAAWADQTIAAKLEKLRLPEPIGYSDKTGKHYFQDLALAKRLMPDEDFIPLYSHPPMNHVLDVGQMVKEEKTIAQHQSEFEEWANEYFGLESDEYELNHANELVKMAWTAWKASKGI